MRGLSLNRPIIRIRRRRDTLISTEIRICRQRDLQLVGEFHVAYRENFIVIIKRPLYLEQWTFTWNLAKGADVEHDWTGIVLMATETLSTKRIR